ncbi:MAG: hypothetical protein ACOCWG_01175, partial [bacterium]
MINKNIKIITTEPIPKGMAASNRILSYAKGLTKLHQDVTLLSFKPSLNEKYPIRGYYNNVKYQIISNLKSHPKYKILIPLYFLLGLGNSFKTLVKERKASHNYIILVSNKPIVIFTYYIISKLLNYRYIQEKSEFPFVLYKKSFLGKIYSKFYVAFFYKLFDGIIVMTHELKDYFNTKISKKASLHIMPMTVETDRFENGKKIFAFDYIAYCGNMGNNKDGVDILI